MSSSITSIQGLTSQIFDGVQVMKVAKATRPTVGAIGRNLLIYQYTGEDTGIRASLLACFTLYGRSSSVSSNPWETWVLSYMAVAFPGLGEKIIEESGVEYTLVSIPEDFIAAVAQAEDTLKKGEVAADLPNLAGMPVPQGSYDVDLFNGTSIKSVYGYAALLVFLMGKQITPANRANFIRTRPKNIIDKFAIPEEQRFVLSGAGRIADTALTHINVAWNASTGGRRAVVTTFVGFRGSSGMAYEIVFFMFRMLENAYMQPAYFIHQLLQAIPSTVTIPILKPAYELYAQSVRDFASFPEELRPYAKLMLGDSTKLFHSKSLQDLTACAVLFLGQDNDTIKAYRAPGGERAKKLFTELCAAQGIKLEDFSFITTATIDI